MKRYLLTIDLWRWPTEWLPADGLRKRYVPARRYIAPVDELLPSR